MFSTNQPNFVGLVSRAKLTGAGKHVGVLLPSGQVAHMTRTGAELVSFDEFAQEKPVMFERAASITSYQQIQWRASMSIGRTPAYDLVKFNCEHYATLLLGEELQSQQITVLALLTLFGAIWFVHLRAG
ncbi:hypothetical protein M2282_005961 [Variovorax boronicumulans]|nr:hypothetical protein [Variovorax boronicumulans]